MEGPGTHEGEAGLRWFFAERGLCFPSLFVRHRLHNTTASDLLTKLVFKSQQESLSYRRRLYKQMNAQGTQFGRQQLSTYNTVYVNRIFFLIVN